MPAIGTEAQVTAAEACYLASCVLKPCCRHKVSDVQQAGSVPSPQIGNGASAETCVLRPAASLIPHVLLSSWDTFLEQNFFPEDETAFKVMPLLYIRTAA